MGHRVGNIYREIIYTDLTFGRADWNEDIDPEVVRIDEATQSMHGGRRQKNEMGFLEMMFKGRFRVQGRMEKRMSKSQEDP